MRALGVAGVHGDDFLGWKNLDVRQNFLRTSTRQKQLGICNSAFRRNQPKSGRHAYGLRDDAPWT